jgi:Ricin-type beta-trefoil lectin domain-like
MGRVTWRISVPALNSPPATRVSLDTASPRRASAPPGRPDVGSAVWPMPATKPNWRTELSTPINGVRHARLAFTRAAVVLAGLVLAGAGMAGAAHAQSAAAGTTLPDGPVAIRTNAGALLALKAGPSVGGHAKVSVAFESPLYPTPDDMQWVAVPDGPNTFYLCSKTASKELDPVFGLACLGVAGTNVMVNPIEVHPSQRWVIVNKDPVRPQTLTLRNVWSGLYLDTGPNPKSGTEPTLQPFKQSASQQWFIKPAKQ